MATAITPLANITLSSTALTVTFSSISGLYRDCYFVLSTGTANLGEEVRVQFNSDTATNYHFVNAYGNGSTATSQTGNYAFIPLSRYNTGEMTSTPTVFKDLTIFDYAQTDKHKSVLSRNSESGQVVGMLAGRWASTSALTSVTFYLSGANKSFAAGSTFALYGVSA